MESIFWVIAIGAAVIWFFRWLGSQDQEENSRTSIPNLQTRVRHDTSQGRDIYNIEARGRMPVDGVKIRWECRLVDIRTGNPVLTLVPNLQEEDSMAYFFQSSEMDVPPGGFINQWGTVAIAPGESVLIAPYSGRRSVQVVLDLDYKGLPGLPIPTIYQILGNSKDLVDGWRTIKQFTHTLSMNFELPGYVEEEEKKQSARILTVRLAVGMAWVDGHLDRAEGQVIQQWIRRHAHEFADDEEFRAFARKCNEAMRETDAQVRAGSFSLGTLFQLARELVGTGNPRWKYETIELLHKIAAADGVAQEEETRMLRRLSGLLGLDPKEVERIRDKEFMKRKKPTDDDPDPSSILDELGIPRDLPPDEIKKRLRAEFRKWSGRLNALPEGKEREYAQWMIDRIAAARKQYE